MLSLQRQAQRLLVVVSVCSLGALAALTPANASAVAPGCTSTNPTALGGEAIGSDGRSVNELIGIDLRDANNTPVNANGQPLTSGGYGVVDLINRTVPATGDATGAGTRSWGDPNATGAVLCVAANITKAYLETYPRNPSLVTDKTRYGAGARYGVPFVAGAIVNFAADLPLRYDQGGITGSVIGKISYNRQAVTASQITRMRAFSTDAGLSCQPGISGFSAHYDSLTADSRAKASNYLLGYLAGGRCGAASQSYTLYLDCNCGGTVHTLHVSVAVSTGTQLTVNWAFSNIGDSVTVQ